MHVVLALQKCQNARKRCSWGAIFQKILAPILIKHNLSQLINSVAEIKKKNVPL